MEKLECGIVKDLLVSYRDGLLSEDVKAAVEEHLGRCETCRAAYSAVSAQMQAAAQEQALKAHNFQRKMKKSHIWLIFGAAAAGITLFALLAVFVGLFLFGGAPSIAKGAENYTSEMTRLSELKTGCVRTGFICFPEKLPEGLSEDDAVFYSFYQDTLFDPTDEFFLEVKYSGKDYAAEVERLENTCKVFAYERKELIRGGDNYPYPAYVAIDGYGYTYEYAILTGENRIAYIFLSFMNNPDKLKAVPREYLPKDYEKRMSSPGLDGYNIYIDPILSNDEAWFTDYSRDSHETVENWHVVNIDEDDMFSVLTTICADRSELVDRCELRHSDMRSDIDTIVNADCIPEARGKQYVGARLDGDRVIVTCSDDSGEKEYVYTIE